MKTNVEVMFVKKDEGIPTYPNIFKVTSNPTSIYKLYSQIRIIFAHN